MPRRRSGGPPEFARLCPASAQCMTLDLGSVTVRQAPAIGLVCGPKGLSREWRRMQRVRIGLTGLAFVFLAVLLAAIFTGQSRDEAADHPQSDRAAAARRGAARARRRRRPPSPPSRSPSSASRPAKRFERGRAGSARPAAAAAAAGRRRAMSARSRADARDSPTYPQAEPSADAHEDGQNRTRTNTVVD